jgi:hypothetical protein
MAGTGSEEHRARARRAQQLGDHAREQAGGEREAAERSERLMAESVDPVLIDLHRRAAALHRRALQQYEEAADLHLLHAEHERRAVEGADAIDSGGSDPGARGAAADDRDHVADLRDAAADQRERRADERDALQDERERLQDERERRFDEATGRSTPHRTPGRRDPFAQARATLRRIEAKVARDDATLDRQGAVARRDQAAIDRESADTARSEPPPGSGPNDQPGDESR